ncbi:MAG: Nif3-like dinuclear metal center hexameric protein [Solirubrobacteraceae bacterium]
MAVLLTELIAECDRVLEPGRFKDYGPNGLQVPGCEQVERIATGVSASVELFEQAVESGAQLLIVHHGLFWGSGSGPIDARMKQRLKLLFDADMSLAAYHLPLDAHIAVGNNALIADGLGAEFVQPFAMHHSEPIGVLAQLPGDGLPANELIAQIHRLTSRKPLVFDAGPANVRRVAIVSGAGSGYLADAVRLGVDAFITGEPAERVMGEAREGKIHFIAAGHYATETFGIKRLGEHLSERFGVEHVFLDVPNPI